MAAQEHVLLSTEQYNRLIERLKNCENVKTHKKEKEPGATVSTDKKDLQHSSNNAEEPRANAAAGYPEPRDNRTPSSSHAHTPTSRPQAFITTDTDDKRPNMEDSQELTHKQDERRKRAKKLKDKIIDKSPTRTTAEREQVKEKKRQGAKPISKEAIRKKLSPPGISAKKGVAKLQKTKRKWVKLTD